MGRKNASKYVGDHHLLLIGLTGKNRLQFVKIEGMGKGTKKLPSGGGLSNRGSVRKKTTACQPRPIVWKKNEKKIFGFPDKRNFILEPRPGEKRGWPRGGQLGKNKKKNRFAKSPKRDFLRLIKGLGDSEKETRLHLNRRPPHWTSLQGRERAGR